MTIHKVPDNMDGTRPIAGLHRTPQAAKKAAAGRPAQAGDRVSLSDLAELAASGAKKFAEETGSRPASLSQFRELVDQPVHLPDRVVDEIIRRMVQA